MHGTHSLLASHKTILVHKHLWETLLQQIKGPTIKSCLYSLYQLGLTNTLGHMIDWLHIVLNLSQDFHTSHCRLLLVPFAKNSHFCPHLNLVHKIRLVEETNGNHCLSLLDFKTQTITFKAIILHIGRGHHRSRNNSLFAIHQFKDRLTLKIFISERKIKQEVPNRVQI